MRVSSLVMLVTGGAVNFTVMAGVVVGVTLGVASSVPDQTVVRMASGANPKLAKTRILYYQQSEKISEAIGILKNDKQARPDSPDSPSGN